jgi:hypothetical protein
MGAVLQSAGQVFLGFEERLDVLEISRLGTAPMTI